MYRQTRLFNEINNHLYQSDSQKNLQAINFSQRTEIDFQKIQKGFPLGRKNHINKVVGLNNTSFSLERSSEKSIQLTKGKKLSDRVARTRGKQCNLKLSISLNELSKSLQKLKVLEGNIKTMRKQRNEFTRNSEDKTLRKVLDNIEETTEEQQTLIIPVEGENCCQAISCDVNRKNKKFSFDYYLLGFKQVKLKPKYQKSKSKSKNQHKNQKSARAHFNDYGY